jgi:CheY-like chemotaxis protein
MNKNGPIVIIEDDAEDQQVLAMVLTDLGYTNEIIFFEDGLLALEHLKQDGFYPFLVISDVNMPKLNGFELRRLIYTNEQLSRKCIPYLFFTTAASEQAVVEAYSSSVQGFFVKPADYEELRHTVYLMIEYWKVCRSPANFLTFYTEDQDRV